VRKYISKLSFIQQFRPANFDRQNEVFYLAVITENTIRIEIISVKNFGKGFIEIQNCLTNGIQNLCMACRL